MSSSSSEDLLRRCPYAALPRDLREETAKARRGEKAWSKDDWRRCASAVQRLAHPGVTTPPPPPLSPRLLAQLCALLATLTSGGGDDGAAAESDGENSGGRRANRRDAPLPSAAAAMACVRPSATTSSAMAVHALVAISNAVAGTPLGSELFDARNFELAAMIALERGCDASSPASLARDAAYALRLIASFEPPSIDEEEEEEDALAALACRVGAALESDSAGSGFDAKLAVLATLAPRSTRVATAALAPRAASIVQRLLHVLLEDARVATPAVSDDAAALAVVALRYVELPLAQSTRARFIAAIPELLERVDAAGPKIGAIASVAYALVELVDPAARESDAATAGRCVSLSVELVAQLPESDDGAAATVTMQLFGIAAACGRRDASSLSAELSNAETPVARCVALALQEPSDRRLVAAAVNCTLTSCVDRDRTAALVDAILAANQRSAFRTAASSATLREAAAAAKSETARVRACGRAEEEAFGAHESALRAELASVRGQAEAAAAAARGAAATARADAAAALANERAATERATLATALAEERTARVAAQVASLERGRAEQRHEVRQLRNATAAVRRESAARAMREREASRLATEACARATSAQQFAEGRIAVEVERAEAAERKRAAALSKLRRFEESAAEERAKTEQLYRKLILVTRAHDAKQDELEAQAQECDLAVRDQARAEQSLREVERRGVWLKSELDRVTAEGSANLAEQAANATEERDALVQAHEVRARRARKKANEAAKTVARLQNTIASLESVVATREAELEEKGELFERARELFGGRK